MMMMAIDGSTVHEAATIPEVDYENDFSNDFKVYLRNEQLTCSRSDPFGPNCFGWVFWSKRNHQTQLDNYADLIRHALQKLIAKKEQCYCLVQFWAPTKTSEGRTLLTTQFQPFALAPTYWLDERSRLCSYRMGMCREYNNSFYADADCPEQQLGLPGRVFLNQFPESIPDIKHYSLKEYPQRDLALRCRILSSKAAPVFDHSTHACVGVLEIVYQYLNLCPGTDNFLSHISYIFQEFGLQCFDGYKVCKMQIGAVNKARRTAFMELKKVLKTVCKIHKLPLAMTWVPCIACDGLLRGELPAGGIEFIDQYRYPNLLLFVKVSKCTHVSRGVVARTVLSSPNILYCSDITQLSLAEYPLVVYARECELRGWFTIWLQSSHTANDIYVLELFLPTGKSYCDDSWTLLSLILGTMEENFKTFKLASGQELGDSLSVEVMDFQNGQKNHFVQNIQATRFSRDPELVKPVRNTDMVESFRPLPGEDQEQELSLNSLESTARVCPMVTIKARSPCFHTIKFSLSSSSRFVELQQEVVKRLNQLDAGTYRVFYEDGENEIACDEDLQQFLHTSRSLGNTTVVVQLVPNQ